MSAGIEALFAKARESLAAAHELIKDGYNDFAASRAYYACFMWHQRFWPTWGNRIAAILL